VPAQTAASQQRRYQATAMVLQSRDQGPELCLGGVARSLPPACGGLPIPNWRWDQVAGEQAANSTVWGRYRLVGTYDGASFTVIGANLAPPDRQPSHEEQFKDEPKPACPEPEGGWQRSRRAVLGTGIRIEWSSPARPSQLTLNSPLRGWRDHTGGGRHG
jgi:hypothetical protein